METTPDGKKSLQPFFWLPKIQPLTVVAPFSSGYAKEHIMNDGRLRTTHRLARAIMALLAILAIGFAPIPAHAAEAPRTAVASQTVTGRRTVSVASDGRGLTLGLLEGDQVEVRGNTATISDANGAPVATIEAEPPQGYKVAYDAHHRYLTVVSTSPFRARGCTSNKWAQWLVGAAANGMVCVPLGIGVGGLTGGVGGALAGGACAAGADALKTWVSC